MNCCKKNDGGSPLKKSKKLPPMAVDSSEAIKNEEKVPLLEVSISNANANTSANSKASPEVAASAKAPIEVVDQENLRPTTAVTERISLIANAPKNAAEVETDEAAA